MQEEMQYWIWLNMIEGIGAGELLRIKDDKYYAVTRTKGYRWIEAEIVKANKLEDKIDMSYFNVLLDDAIANISKFGDFEWFISNDKNLEPPSDPIGIDDHPPFLPCGRDYCDNCKQLGDNGECKMGYDNASASDLKGE